MRTLNRKEVMERPYANANIQIRSYYFLAKDVEFMLHNSS